MPLDYLNPPNPKLPDPSREYLQNRIYVEAVTDYTSDAYLSINRYLREGSWLEARDEATHLALEAAFSELEPFDRPIKVFRAFNLPREEVDSVVRGLLDARNNGKIIQFRGYLSSTTNWRLPSLESAPIKLVILANRGLDVRPASAAPLEDELLLKHGTSFLVHKVRRPSNGGQVVAKLEQMI